MDQFCPECKNLMTPSLVGYLCINCGHTKRFLNPTEALTQTPSSPPVSAGGDIIREKGEDMISIPKRASIKETLRRLTIPELPSPIQNHPKLHNMKKEAPHLQTNWLPSTKKTELVQPTPEPSPNISSDITQLQAALHTSKDTSLWVLLGIAVILLVISAGILFLIILS